MDSYEDSKDRTLKTIFTSPHPTLREILRRFENAGITTQKQLQATRLSTIVELCGDLVELPEDSSH